MASLQIETSCLTLFAVYAPTRGHDRQQMIFYENIREKLEALSIEELKYVVLCGDFNVQLSKLNVVIHRYAMTITRTQLTKTLTASLKW